PPASPRTARADAAGSASAGRRHPPDGRALRRSRGDAPSRWRTSPTPRRPPPARERARRELSLRLEDSQPIRDLVAQGCGGTLVQHLLVQLERVRGVPLALRDARLMVERAVPVESGRRRPCPVRLLSRR